MTCVFIHNNRIHFKVVTYSSGTFPHVRVLYGIFYVIANIVFHNMVFSTLPGPDIGFQY